MTLLQLGEIFPNFLFSADSQSAGGLIDLFAVISFVLLYEYVFQGYIKIFVYTQGPSVMVNFISEDNIHLVICKTECI